jgi:hypothetical protein
MRRVVTTDERSIELSTRKADDGKEENRDQAVHHDRLERTNERA